MVFQGVQSSRSHSHLDDLDTDLAILGISLPDRTLFRVAHGSPQSNQELPRRAPCRCWGLLAKRVNAISTERVLDFPSSPRIPAPNLAERTRPMKTVKDPQMEKRLIFFIHFSVFILLSETNPIQLPNSYTQ